VLTFPASGILAIVCLLLSRFVGLRGDDVVGWAELVSSDTYLVSQYGYILAYALPFFGFWALYMLLMRSQIGRLAFWGFIGALLGSGLPLTMLGVLGYASPVIGRLYLQEDTHLPEMIAEIAMGSSLALGLPGAVLYAGGCTASGVAVWKCETLARRSGVTLALRGLFVPFGFRTPPVLLVGWVLPIVTGGWFSWSVWQDKATGEKAAEAGRRQALHRRPALQS
jgi:hypothetical protein